MPPIADTNRSVTYTVSASTTNFAFPFPLFGQSDLQVYLNGRLLTYGTDYSVTSSLYGQWSLAPNPVTDSIVVLTVPITSGFVEIYGAIRPSRTIQATSPFSTFAFNYSFSYLVACLRELYQKFTSVLSLPHGAVSGSSYYDAALNKISNVGAPVATTDAARLADVQAATFASGNVSAPTLAQVGSVIQATATGIWGWVTGYPTSIQTFGGSDDGVTDNIPALNAYIAKYGRVGGRLRLPFISSGNYYFNTATTIDFSGIIIDPDPGVVIHGWLYLASNALQVTRSVTVDFDVPSVPIRYPIQVSPRGYTAPIEKQQWMSNGDLERVTHAGVTVSGFWTATNATDAFSNDVSWALATDTATINLTNDGVSHLVLSGALGGQEYNAVFKTAGTYKRIAFFKFTNGWASIEFTDLGTAGATLRTKVIGSSIVTAGPFFWKGASDHLSYKPLNSLFTVRAVDKYRVSVLLNGQEIFTNGHVNLSYLGELEAMGFGVRSDAVGDNTSGLVIDYWTKVTKRTAGGKADIRLLIIGDSKSAPSVPDSYSEHLLHNLEYEFGSQIASKTNLAVIGDTAAQQYTRLTAAGVAGANVAVIDVGTNDVQTGNTESAMTATIGQVCSYLVTNGVTPILMIPYLWYPVSLNYLGRGGSTTNYEKGAAYRAAIMRYAASNGYRVVDLSQELPSVIGSYTNPAYGARDLIVKDNIHPTGLTNQIVGKAAARAVMSVFNPPMTCRVGDTSINGQYFANGWTQGAVPLTYAISSDGIVTLSGNMNYGTRTDGTVILNLPRNLWPNKQVVMPCSNDIGGTPRFSISAGGVVTIFGMSTGTLLQVPPITYQSSVMFGL